MISLPAGLFFKECTAAAAFPTWRLRRLQYDTFYLVAEAKVNSLALGNNSRRGSMSRTKLLSEVGNEKVPSRYLVSDKGFSEVKNSFPFA